MMGRVIKYTDKVRQGRKVSPSAESPSAGVVELTEAKRGENSKDTVGPWTEEDLNLHKLLLLDLMEMERK